MKAFLDSRDLDRGDGGGVDPSTHTRELLAATMRVFAGLGYSFGDNGHVTVRDPREPETFWANPLDVPFADTTADDVVRVDRDGKRLEGARETSLDGFLYQRRLHDAPYGIDAVVHVHSPYGFVWASNGGVLEPLNTDSALIHGRQAYFGGFSIDPQAPGDPASVVAESTRVIIQRSHGLIGLGRSLAEAAFYLIAAERAAHCRLLLGAEARPMPESEARLWRLTPGEAERAFGYYLSRSVMPADRATGTGATS